MKRFNIVKTNNSATLSSNVLKTKSPIPTFQSCSTFQTGNLIAYSIPKQQRFRNSYKKASCESIYTLPELKSPRSTTMGFGFRKEFINKKELDQKPSPVEYNFNSLFLDNIHKRKGYTISNRIKYNEGEAKNNPGPCDYNNSANLEWVRKSPCSMKFRKDFFYQDDVKQAHDVSPMKYLPETKIVENNRYRNNSISFGIGLLHYQIKEQMDKIPGPGRYNLPSVFDRRKTGKIPLN